MAIQKIDKTPAKKKPAKKAPKKPSSNQVGNKDSDGKFSAGNKANPEGVGGFGDNPQNRSDGRWSKEGSITYQYNLLMRLSTAEFNKYKPETVAQQIAYKRIMIARTNAGLHDTKEITDRTEGKAPQFIGIGDGDEYKEQLGATIVFEDKPEAEDSNTDVS